MASVGIWPDVRRSNLIRLFCTSGAADRWYGTSPPFASALNEHEVPTQPARSDRLRPTLLGIDGRQLGYEQITTGRHMRDDLWRSSDGNMGMSV